MYILLLEDDQNYRESLCEYLESIDNAKVDAFENGDDALASVYTHDYDLLLLDVKVPGKSGYDITQQLRKDGFEVPIILVTSLIDVDNLSIGYEMGCDDYLRKPFSTKELHYRIMHALSKSQYSHANAKINLHFDFIFDTQQQILTHNDQKITLTPIETKIIDLLVKNRGNFIDHYTIIDTVWQDDSVSGVDLRMHIFRLRAKSDARLIISERGKGYKIDKL